MNREISEVIGIFLNKQPLIPLAKLQDSGADDELLQGHDSECSGYMPIPEISLVFLSTHQVNCHRMDTRDSNKTRIVGRENDMDNTDNRSYPIKPSDFPPYYSR